MANAEISWPRDALPSGTELNGYRIEAVIGRGGFGITYRANDGIDQVFAIKECFPKQFAVRLGTEVLPSDQESLEPFHDCLNRFGQEARALRRLATLGAAGDGVVKVVTFFLANSTAYVVMEYLAGDSLDRVVKASAGGIKPALLQDILPRLLHAVGCVHSAGLLHRDIKPANIMLRADGRPVLIDFGAARVSSLGHTMTFTQIFSEGYAPIEQVSGARQGPFSDIYALGATLYRAIGCTPVDSFTRRQAVMRGKRDPQRPAAEAGAGRYDANLLAAIDSAMVVEPEERPQTVAALVALLETSEDSQETVKVAGPMPTRAPALDDGPASSPPKIVSVTDDHLGPVIQPEAPKGAGKGAIRAGIAALSLLICAFAIVETVSSERSSAPNPTPSAPADLAAIPASNKAAASPVKEPEAAAASVGAGGTKAISPMDFYKEREAARAAVSDAISMAINADLPYGPELTEDANALIAQAETAVAQGDRHGADASFTNAIAVQATATQAYLNKSLAHYADLSKSLMEARDLAGAQYALAIAKRVKKAIEALDQAPPPASTNTDDLSRSPTTRRVASARDAALLRQGQAVAMVNGLGLHVANFLAGVAPLLAQATIDEDKGALDQALLDCTKASDMVSRETHILLDREYSAYASIARREMKAGDLTGAQSALTFAKKIKSSIPDWK